MASTAVSKRRAKTGGDAPFDYQNIAPRDAAKCEQAVEKIAGYQRRMAGDIVAIGKELLSVKERLEHGQFGDWLEHYFKWSPATAKRMMQAAETFKTLNLSDLTIDQSALYLLASDKCPDEIREEVIERAENGERITHASVKQALQDLVGDDDEPEPPRSRRVRDEEDQVDDEIVQELPPRSRFVPSDGWNIAAFVIDAHKWIDAWRNKCPEDDRVEMAQVLRDLAEQIERAK